MHRLPSSLEWPHHRETDTFLHTLPILLSAIIASSKELAATGSLLNH